MGGLTGLRAYARGGSGRADVLMIGLGLGLGPNGSVYDGCPDDVRRVVASDASRNASRNDSCNS